MVIKRKDFQKLADIVNEFQKKLTEASECAELRDALNLTLFLMQKHYRFLQLKMRDHSKTNGDFSVQQPGQFVNNIKVSDDNKFEWTWVSSDSPRMIESLPLDKKNMQMPVSLIVQAAKDGDLNMIVHLTEKDPQCVNDIDSYGRSALFYCIHYGQINAMAALLQRGANPEISCNEGSLPLHIACFHGNAAAAELILHLLHNHQPDIINYQDNYGRSAVHWATVSPTTDCLRLLIKYGAKLSLRDRQGLSPAMWACRKDRLQHLQLLLQNGLSTTEPDGIERDEKGLTWLHWAVVGGTECFTALMDDQTVQLRDRLGRTAFLFAAEKGCIDALKVMKDRIPRERLFDVDNNGRTALHLATMSGQGRIAGLLLDSGLSPEVRDNDNQTPIDLAKNRQLNYCIRVFAAHLSATSQPNFRPSAKPVHGTVQGFSPFGGQTADSSPATPNDKLPPHKIRPPLSETPSFVPRPPQISNRMSEPNSTRSVDQEGINTGLQPTPPPPDARITSRANRRRLANNRLSREGTLQVSGNYEMQTSIDDHSEQVVPVQQQNYATAEYPMPISKRHHSDEMEIYSTVEHMPPNSEDVTIGVAPLTEEALAHQQQMLQQQYAKQTSQSLADQHMAENGHRDGDDMSTKSVNTEDSASSHDSTADTVVVSPTKRATDIQRHKHHNNLHNYHDPREESQHTQAQRPAVLDSGPRPFLASAKSAHRDDPTMLDDPTPPSKISILSSSPVSGLGIQQPGHFQSSYLKPSEQEANENKQQQIGMMQNNSLSLPPTWAHLPPVQPMRGLPPPPDMPGYENLSHPRKKGRKNKSKRNTQHMQQPVISPLQPIYSVAPSPPPPQVSPSNSNAVTTSSYPSNQYQDHRNQQNTIRERSKRSVDTEHFDQMETEVLEGPAGPVVNPGFQPPGSPVLATGRHRPPTRRGISTEEQERAIIANNSANSGTPTMLSRRSRQNAPLLSPSPTRIASPQPKPQENNHYSSEKQKYHTLSDSLPSPLDPSRTNNKQNRSLRRQSPVVASPSGTPPIPAITSRIMNSKSEALSGDESNSNLATIEEVSDSPPPPLSATANSRRRDRIGIR